MNQKGGSGFSTVTKGDQPDYEELGRKYEAINDFDNAEKYYKLANTPSARKSLSALFARVTAAMFSDSRILFYFMLFCLMTFITIISRYKFRNARQVTNLHRHMSILQIFACKKSYRHVLLNIHRSTNLFFLAVSPPDSPQVHPLPPTPQAYIRLTCFDKETNQPVRHEVYPDDKTKGNINIRAYKLRMRFTDAQVEVVVCPDGVQPPPRTEPISRSRYLEVRFHDWVVVALSKLASGAQLQDNVFRSIGNIPLKSNRLRAVLERVLKHPLYRGQQMHFTAIDGVHFHVKGGRITETYPNGELYQPSEVNIDAEGQCSTDEESTPEDDNFDAILRQFPRRKTSLPRLPNIDTTERHKTSIKTRSKRRHRRRSISYTSNLELTSSMEEEDEEDENTDELFDSSPEEVQPPEPIPEPRPKFSTAVTTIYCRKNLNVLELPEAPRSLEELFVSAAKVIQETEQHNRESGDEGNRSDEDCLCIYTRVFTTTGRELRSISDVVAYCVPQMDDTTHSQGLATIVFSMGEDFC